MRRLNENSVSTWYKWVIAVLSGMIIFVGLGWNSGTRSLYTRTITVLRDIDRRAGDVPDGHPQRRKRPGGDHCPPSGGNGRGITE